VLKKRLCHRPNAYRWWIVTLRNHRHKCWFTFKLICFWRIWLQNALLPLRKDWRHTHRVSIIYLIIVKKGTSVEKLALNLKSSIVNRFLTKLWLLSEWFFAHLQVSVSQMKYSVLNVYPIKRLVCWPKNRIIFSETSIMQLEASVVTDLKSDSSQLIVYTHNQLLQPNSNNNRSLRKLNAPWIPSSPDDLYLPLKKENYFIIL
jgi:hypothetical protein